MKTILSLILTTVISHLGLAQFGLTFQSETTPGSYFYIMPFGGVSTHLTTTSEPAWQYFQVKDPEPHQGWNSHLDGDKLYDQDVEYSFEPNGNYGLEIGMATIPTKFPNAVTYFGLCVEYQERSFTSVQEYHNGVLLGRTEFSGKETRVKYGLALHTFSGAYGLSLGLWYKRSTFPERNIQFSSYREGQLEYTEQLYPSDPSTSFIDYSQYWIESSGSVGGSIGFNYQPIEFLRLSLRYEFTHVSATIHQGDISTIFERNGINAHSFMLGLGFPLVYDY